MRKKVFGIEFSGSALMLCLITILIITIPSHFVGVHAFDDDFDDDGIVEEVLSESLETEELYESPKYDPKQFYFADHFDDIQESRKRWIKSQAKKDDTAEEIAKYDGVWEWESPQRIVSKKDIGLVLKSKAKHAAIASPLSKPFKFSGEKPLVVQYEVTLQDGQDCGGSYIKLLSLGKETQDLTKFNDKTPYTIMFGPDKCGNDIKMHFIFRHVNPINGSISEKHCNKPKDRLEEPFKDKLPHLYYLIVRPDNTFEIRVDHKIINEGSLLSDFAPPVNPPREIDDPTDQKPEDWDDREKISDPTASKPNDWDEDAPPQIPDPTAIQPDDWLVDEPEMIPDPNAQKPEDWDDEIDGTWEPPLVDNPICEKASGCGLWKAPLIANKEYKGKWRAPMIDNPNYQGKWAPRKIPNPDFYEDLTPFKMTPISAVGIELWSMSSDILFDNLIITDDEEVASDFAAKTFDMKRRFIDKESETFFNKMLVFANENPWAWRIGIILIGTPLAFTLYRVLSSGGKKEPEADAKKTDAVQKDDEKVEEDSNEGDASRTSNTTTQKPSHKPKKSDLDVKEDTVTFMQDEPNGEGDGGGEQDGDAERDLMVEGDRVAMDAEESEETESAIKSKGARKRRVRKDES